MPGAEWYFVGASGTKYFYAALATTIRDEHPNVVGAHIFKQITALRLWEEFTNGHTPYPLPFSFTD